MLKKLLYLSLKTSQHRHEFPLILIFGIATSPVIIHRLLPHAVSSLLCIELFQSLSCKEHLAVILDQVRRKNVYQCHELKQKLPNIYIRKDTRKISMSLRLCSTYLHSLMLLLNYVYSCRISLHKIIFSKICFMKIIMHIY